MSRWFRHYAGMMRDEKLVRVAIRSKQTIERVLWVWGAILESAAETDDGGLFEVDQAEVSYFLRADEADIGRIIDTLEQMGRIQQGRVVNWGDRQFQSDRSAERQKRHRERRKSEGDGVRGDESAHPPSLKGEGDGGVTSLSRHGDAPELKTETDTKTEIDPDSPESRLAALYTQIEIDGFTLEFDRVDVPTVLIELVVWADGLDDCPRPLDRKKAIYGALKKRQAKAEAVGRLMDLRNNGPPPLEAAPKSALERFRERQSVRKVGT